MRYHPSQALAQQRPGKQVQVSTGNVTRDHVCVPVETDEAPNHPALSLTLCAICLEPMSYQKHGEEQGDRDTRPRRVIIDETEPEAVLV